MPLLALLLFVLAAAAAEPEVATTVAFTDGPTVDAEGNVYFTETTFNRIMKLSRDGTLAVFRENSNAANGLVFDARWRLVVCEGGDKKKGGRPRITHRHQNGPRRSAGRQLRRHAVESTERRHY